MVSPDPGAVVIGSSGHRAQVFQRSNPGFDGFVGNPPFAHMNTVIDVGGPNYLPFFQARYPRFHGYADLVVYFVRRVHSLARKGACWTLVCTNTVAEGKSLASGLMVVVEQGGELICAQTQVKWPGVANVEVCAPTVFVGKWIGPKLLNDKAVNAISPSLEAGGTFEPKSLPQNEGIASQGFLTYGRGFVLVPDVANEMLRASASNRDVIQPMISAKDVAEEPFLRPGTYVINFGTMSERECAEYREPFEWLETHAKPERQASSREDARKYWWRLVGRSERVFGAARRSGYEFVLANLHVSKHHVFVRLPIGTAPEKNVNVFGVESWAAFAALQSRWHEVWADKLASSLRTDRRYTTSTCFATFPFPSGWQTDPGLEAAGKAYYEHRAALMIANEEGLTKTYNRFHDEDNEEPGIVELRRLHAAMDLAMIRAYGWDPDTLDLTCHFLPIHATDEDDDAGDDSKPVKKRLRWSDETRDRVLAKLLELNEQYAKAGTAPTSPDAFTLAAPEAPAPRSSRRGGSTSKATTSKRKPGEPTES